MTMTNLPELTRKDVEEALGELRRREKQGRRLFAFHGRYAPGHAEDLMLEGSERFQVVPVKSEIDLRSHLPPLGVNTAPIAFIVPWSGEMPLDIAGRFSRDGRIKRIGKESRLKRLLGASDLGEDVLGSPLAEHLLANPRDLDGTPSLGGLVTLDALFDRWLKARFRIDTTGGLALDLLLGWAAIDNRSSDLDELEVSSPALVSEIESHLHHRLRDAGVVVWRAWRTKRGRALLELAVLFEALASHRQGPAFTWRGMQQAELGVTDAVTAERVAIELGDAVGRALYFIESLQAGVVKSILASAEAKVTAPDVRPLLVSSKRLPIAWDLRLAALGQALEDGVRDPSPDAVKRAGEARKQLETHVSFRDPKYEAVSKRAERAVQLLAWLSSPQSVPELSTETPYRDAETLGRWYVEEGGYVDLARRRARGPADTPFGKGVQAVVSKADSIRRDLDRRFARSLRGWIEAGRPSGQVFPIDMAVEKVALRFLQGDPTRKLLIILMDGMPWADLTSILESLSTWTAPWGSIAWHASAQGKIGTARRPVMFAQLPTVTEVSRAAFFAGVPTPNGATYSTSDDPKRWENHTAVRKIEAENVAPRLLLRGEGHTSDGVASQEALTMVGDPKRRLVALVINAIDASLKGDTQQRHEWTVDSIGSLAQLLERAREAGRAVLFAADHGHVPGDLLASKGAYTDASTRYRSWRDPSDPIGEDEVGFHGTGVCATKGAHGLICLSDEHSRYGSAAHAGEHGGASLAEVVAPCLLVAPDDGRDAFDSAQKVMPMDVPSWWHLDVEASVAEIHEPAPAPEPPRRPSKKIKAQVPEEQLPLGQLGAPPPPPPPATPIPPRRTSSTKLAKPSPLATSEVFVARTPNKAERERVVAGVNYLIERGDLANVDAFCAFLGEPAWRAGGLVRTLQLALNVDGYEALTHDVKGKQVRLHRAVIEAQFGVKL